MLFNLTDDCIHNIAFYNQNDKSFNNQFCRILIIYLNTKIVCVFSPVSEVYQILRVKGGVCLNFNQPYNAPTRQHF